MNKLQPGRILSIYIFFNLYNMHLAKLTVLACNISILIKVTYSSIGPGFVLLCDVVVIIILCIYRVDSLLPLGTRDIHCIYNTFNTFKHNIATREKQNNTKEMKVYVQNI